MGAGNEIVIWEITSGIMKKARKRGQKLARLGRRRRGEERKTKEEEEKIKIKVMMVMMTTEIKRTTNGNRNARRSEYTVEGGESRVVEESGRDGEQRIQNV